MRRRIRRASRAHEEDRGRATGCAVACRDARPIHARRQDRSVGVCAVRKGAACQEKALRGMNALFARGWSVCHTWSLHDQLTTTGEQIMTGVGSKVVFFCVLLNEQSQKVTKRIPSTEQAFKKDPREMSRFTPTPHRAWGADRRSAARCVLLHFEPYRKERWL